MEKQAGAVSMIQADWQLGFDAGEAGKPSTPVSPNVSHALSWFSGYIEGDAKRRGFEYSKGTK